jgi:hypothetical protein
VTLLDFALANGPRLSSPGLHLSEGEAYLRIAAARASREHPILLEMLGDGRLHLSGIAQIAPHITARNRETLLRRATHRSKRQIEELIAELAPRADVPALIRKLPDRRGHPTSDHLPAGAHPPPDRSSAGDHPPAGDHLSAGAAIAPGSPSAGPDIPERSGQPLTRLEIDAAERERQGSLGRPTPSGMGKVVTTNAPGLVEDPRRPVSASSTPPVLRQPPAPVVQPLAPGRYKVQVTASAELAEKLERLQALMRSQIPDGDLGAIVEAAVTEKLARLGRRPSGAEGVASAGVTGSLEGPAAHGS